MHKFRNFWLRLLWEERGEVDVTPEPAAVEPPAASDPAPGATEPPAGESTDPAVDVDPALAGLDAAMKAVLPVDEPTQDGQDGQQGTIPQEFQAALSISPFVTDAQTLQQAVSAANEVWSVAAGQIPARNLLEGIKQANPQGYEAIVLDLREYLGVSGQQAQTTNPIEALKTANPAVFNAINQYVQQQTGQALDGAPDPREQRLQALEQRYAQEEEQRQIAAHNAQVETARAKAGEFMAAALKDHFAEGMQDRYTAPGTGLLWQKALAMNIDPERMQGELLQGKTDTLQKVWKAVEKDEAAAIRRFNENIIKRSKTLQSVVPASKGKVQPKQVQGAPVRKPGESEIDYAKRVWDSGFTA